jgi:hypothetical protein
MKRGATTMAAPPFFIPSKTCFSRSVVIFYTKRIGLAVKDDPKAEEFRNMPLRHVAFLKPEGSFRHKISGISKLTDEAVRAGRMSTEKEEEILGYKRKR